MNNNTKAFFELVRAELWEKEVRLLFFDRVDYKEVMSLADEQSVVRLVTAGLEYIRVMSTFKEKRMTKRSELHRIPLIGFQKEQEPALHRYRILAAGCVTQHR